MTEDIPPGYLRVTDVLKPFTDFSMIDPKVLKNAADRGERVHKFCRAYAEGMLICDVDFDCKGYVEAYKVWFDKMVTSVIHLEKRVNSEKYRISGAFDLLCVLKGDSTPTLVDIKTPASRSLTWQLQTAAYRMLVQDELGYEVGRRVALQLPKDGGVSKLTEYLSHDEDQRKYLNCLELYRFFHG